MFRAAVGRAGDVDLLPDGEHGGGGPLRRLLLPTLHVHLQYGPPLQGPHSRPLRLPCR